MEIRTVFYFSRLGHAHSGPSGVEGEPAATRAALKDSRGRLGNVECPHFSLN